MAFFSDSKFIVLKTSIFSAIFTVIILMLLSYFFNHTWNPFASKTASQPFTVQGTGTATATPDQSAVSFTVTKTATTLQDAQNQANTFTNKIVADLQKDGVTKQDIQTSNYSSYPNYNQNNEGVVQPGVALPIQPQPSSQTIVSYTVSEDVNITLHDISKANTVIDQITKDNAENISGPNLTFSDTKQQQLENDARNQAIANAKQKAQSMSEAAGIHLGKIINIQEGDNSQPIVRPLMMANDAMGTAKSVPTQISPGQNTVTSTVTLSYQTY
jgi:hypothetical protein